MRCSMYEIAWGDQKFWLETTWFLPFQMGSLTKCGLAFKVINAIIKLSLLS